MTVVLGSTTKGSLAYLGGEDVPDSQIPFGGWQWGHSQCRVSGASLGV
jgi:hypothetical protein